jgi:hypothetical protein
VPIGGDEYLGFPAQVQDCLLGFDLVLCGEGADFLPGVDTLVYLSCEEVQWSQFAAGISVIDDLDFSRRDLNLEGDAGPVTQVTKFDAERYCATWGYRLPRVSEYQRRRVQHAFVNAPRAEVRGLLADPREWCSEAFGEVDPAQREEAVRFLFGFEGPPAELWDAAVGAGERGEVRAFSYLPGIPDASVGFRVAMSAEEMRRHLAVGARR